MEILEVTPERRSEIEKGILEGAPYRRVLRFLLSTRKLAVGEDELLAAMKEWSDEDPVTGASGYALLSLDFPRETVPLVYFLLEGLASQGAMRLLPALLSPLGHPEAARLLRTVRGEGLATDDEIALVLEATFGEDAPNHRETR
jgi:hypothetical protein